MPFLMISVTSLQNKASCQNLSSFNKIGESGITSQFNHWNSCLTQKSLTSAATLVATAATEMWTAAKWRDQTGYFLSYHFNISVTSSIQNWWKKCTNHIKSTSRVEYRRTLIELLIYVEFIVSRAEKTRIGAKSFSFSTGLDVKHFCGSLCCPLWLRGSLQQV